MIKRIFATPYNTRESAGWLIRNVIGLSNKNAGIVNKLASPHIFNERLENRYKVTAIGDIMPMHGNRLEVDGSVKEFLADSDYFIGTFSGVITQKKSTIWPMSLDQRHDSFITEDLAKFFSPDNTFLSVSDNHSGDFGADEYYKSIGLLKSTGFNVFGSDGQPFADINNDLRIVPGTAWSNRPLTRALRIDKSKGFLKPGAFNIFYPHMGYELELYPRPEVVKLAEEMANLFGAVIANHSHCPQPVTSCNAGGRNRLVAYSLGDFCTSLKFKTMRYGLAIKFEIGKDGAGALAIGKAEWKYTECIMSLQNAFKVRFTPDAGIFTHKP